MNSLRRGIGGLMMKKVISRAEMRGRQLDDDCKNAKISKNEYGIDDNRCFCYGLRDC